MRGVENFSKTKKEPTVIGIIMIFGAVIPITPPDNSISCKLLFKNIVAANSHLFMGYSRGCGWESVGKYLYKSVVFLIARYAGLGSGRSEVKPSTSGPLPVRLKADG